MRRLFFLLSIFFGTQLRCFDSPSLSLTPSGSASTQLGGCTLSRSMVFHLSMGDTPMSTRVPTMFASRETTPSRSVWIVESPSAVVGKIREASAVQESWCCWGNKNDKKMGRDERTNMKGNTKLKAMRVEHVFHVPGMTRARSPRQHVLLRG